RLLGRQFLADDQEGVELGVAQLTRIGEDAFDVLARSRRRRAGKVELGEPQLLGKDGTKVALIGPVRRTGVDGAGAGGLGPSKAGKHAGDGDGTQRADLHGFLLHAGPGGWAPSGRLSCRPT